MAVKIAVIYYSSTGTNHRLAQAAEEAATQAGAEVRLRRIQELAPEAAIASNPAWRAHYEETQGVPVATLDDLDFADGYIFSVPTRFGNVPSQFKQFLDTAGSLWAQGKLMNKTVTAMTSASNPHGGQEATLLSLYTTMYHWGAIVVAPGYTDPAHFAAGGNPYGTSATVNEQMQLGELELRAAQQQASRLVQVTEWMKAGQGR